MIKVSVVSTADFMVPASQLHTDDDDETEDDISTISGSTANYGGFPFLAGSAPSSRSPSPDMSFMSEANAAAAAWKGERHHPSMELHPQSNSTLPKSHHQLSRKKAAAMRKSGSYDLVAIRKQRSSTLPSQEHTMSMTRKPAMSGEKKMEDMRRRVVEKKKATEQRMSVGVEIQGTPSPTLIADPLKIRRSHSNDMPIKTISRLSPIMGSSSQHPHIKVVVATPPHSPDMHRAEYRSESPLTESTMARESTHKLPEPDSSSLTSATVSHNTPPTHQPDSVSEKGNKHKPVPSPRKKQNSSDTEYPSSKTAQQQQLSTGDSSEYTQFVMTSVERKRYGTLEREKPTAAPRKRTSSLDKEKSRSGTLERRQRASKTPEPQSFDSKNTTTQYKKTTVGSSKPAFTAVFPADVNKELEKKISSSTKQSSVESSSSVKDDVDPVNPKLKEIGKTLSITSDGSVDSGREHADSVTRSGSNGSGEHKWQRKGARRTGGRHRHHNHTEMDEDDHSSRSRTRSGAISGGAAPRRNTTEDDEQQLSSRSRTRSGAVSGTDASALRRSRRVSPRRPHRKVTQQNSGPNTDHIDFPEPALPSEVFSIEEESMRRARAGNRRAARIGGDLLVAADGEQDWESG